MQTSDPKRIPIHANVMCADLKETPDQHARLKTEDMVLY